ncbi:unnamed protein product [Adineta steineri]|uniref:Uncharacterized protein n=1 Tax=Adineta steineri TaxID=433720 RepID=A0A815MVB9_9BILA|nr:unnamed protein product [Adineta steineri]CAF1488309.1 unnamed protein product [Adineta steineri]
MTLVSKSFYFICLHLVLVSPQFNLDHTDWINESEDHSGLQHNCLYNMMSYENRLAESDQIISYCLTEWPSKFKIRENEHDQKFTFSQLYRDNITSQQLYDWSAPLDVIERYQMYLNQLLTSNDSLLMGTQLYYNCTLPRFGPLCQYSLDISTRYESSNNIINDFYMNSYKPTSLTCYIHLKCDHGSKLTCLDWADICDGYVDCLNGPVDEEHCWQLHTNECKDDEFRCYNGQCIPKIFLNDAATVYDCLDKSDKTNSIITQDKRIHLEMPGFNREDIQCIQSNPQSYRQFTSSCVRKREYLLKEMMFSDTPNSISDDCWLAFKCNYGILSATVPMCKNISINKTFVETMKNTCSDMLIVPAKPIAFGHIYLGYIKEAMLNSTNSLEPQYICYNDRLCNGFSDNKTLLFFTKTTCRRVEDFPVTFGKKSHLTKIDDYIKILYKELSHCNTIIYNNIKVCNSSFMYQCINSSKCITTNRLCDGVNDCDYEDDEQCSLVNGICSVLESNILYKCVLSNKCISIHRFGDYECDCYCYGCRTCEDEPDSLSFVDSRISFQTICDGFIELIPITIDGRNETDETECEYWPCSNNYTRCDGRWNCYNGADEIDCASLSCPLRHHKCVSPETYQFMCLPIEKANNGIIDCVGAIDEPRLCRSSNHIHTDKNFYCKYDPIQPCISSQKLCSIENRCLYKDDERLCYPTRNYTETSSVCSYQYKSNRSDVQNYFCSLDVDHEKLKYRFLLLNDVQLPANIVMVLDSNKRIIDSSNIIVTRQYQERCHRGLPLLVWLDNKTNVTTEACLCPPSFYGNICQYQNQRVSLTVQFRTFSDSRRILFSLVISLIDDSDKRLIHSYQQFTYYYFEHCSAKFNTYLLYSTRPKYSTRNYSIHIDAYEKTSFVYRGSFLIPIKFSFLPVNRIALIINIPRKNDNKESCSDKLCMHGQCRRYVNDPKGTTFCQCHRGWSGEYCTISHTCNCSSDSLCIGISANNRSICVCPMNRWGSQCLLRNDVCQSNQNDTCFNGGRCLPIDEQLIRSEKFICICPIGFRGRQCKEVDMKITLSFHKDIILPQSIALHFILISLYGTSEFGSLYKRIPINEKSIALYWSQPFTIALARVSKSFYVLVPPRNADNRTDFNRTITPLDRCDHIGEILNETIAKLHLIRRIKYYHLSCRKLSPTLSCFYDDTHFCFCNNFHEERTANCFEFNSTKKHNCFGQNSCENGGECLQDKINCPRTLICVCPPCFYGLQCQFSSNLFGLSLDAILGYHIQPYIDMIHQPTIVQTSLAITIIIIIIGLINGIASLITFKNKETQKLGCGFYLYGSSIATLFIVIIFTLKFSILLIAQITYIENRLFLRFQCVSIDFLLRIGLNMDRWLNACVALERAIATIKGIAFNKTKSKKIAGYIILLLSIVIISTDVHDPIYRQLIDENNNDEYDSDDNEKRIWCIVTYPPAIQKFNTAMNILHFFIPFTINLISALIIIVLTTRQRAKTKGHQNYRKLLREQFNQHKHILIGPVTLVILGVPRLIISLTSGCMQSLSQSWLFLIGYFISFIPPMVTFVVFVLPSKLYKKEFNNSVKRLRRTVRSGLRFTRSN